MSQRDSVADSEDEIPLLVEYGPLVSTIRTLVRSKGEFHVLPSGLKLDVNVQDAVQAVQLEEQSLGRRSFRQRTEAQKKPYTEDKRRYEALVKGRRIGPIDGLGDYTQLARLQESSQDQEYIPRETHRTEYKDHEERVVRRRMVIPESQDGSSQLGPDHGTNGAHGSMGIVPRIDDALSRILEDSDTEDFNDIARVPKLPTAAIDSEGPDQSDSDLDSKSEEFDEDGVITVGGRQVSTKQGYRGVLPKFLFKKHLHEKKVAKKRHSFKETVTAPNVARKKKSHTISSTQDYTGLEDLFETNDVERVHIQNSEEEEGEEEDGMVEMIAEESDDESITSSVEIIDIDREGVAEEDHFDGFSAMLASRSSVPSKRKGKARIYKPAGQVSKKKPARVSLGQLRARKKTTQPTLDAPRLSSIGKGQLKSFDSSERLSLFAHVPRESPQPVQRAASTLKENETRPKKKPRIGFGLMPDENAYLPRAPQHFTIIQEAVGDIRTLVPVKRRGVQPTAPIKAALPVETSDMSLLLEALFTGKRIEERDVKFSMGDVNFSFSKVNNKVADDILKFLKRLLDGIRGSRDELKNASNQLAFFLYGFNDRKLYTVLDSYILEYSEKKLHSSIVPEHWYFYAMLGVFLVELSMNGSDTLKKMTQRKLAQHCRLFVAPLISKFPAEHLDSISESIKLMGRLSKNLVDLFGEASASQLSSLVNILQYEEPRWDLLNVSDVSYKGFKNVTNAITELSKIWEVNEDVIYKLYKMFAARKFSSFDEEPQLFDEFLQFIEAMEPSKRCIERITPTSVLKAEEEQISTLKNRIQLLISLTKLSLNDYERLLYELVSSCDPMGDRFKVAIEGVTEFYKVKFDSKKKISGACLDILCQSAHLHNFRTFKPFIDTLERGLSSYKYDVESILEKLVDALQAADNWPIVQKIIKVLRVNLTAINAKFINDKLIPISRHQYNKFQESSILEFWTELCVFAHESKVANLDNLIQWSRLDSPSERLAIWSIVMDTYYTQYRSTILQTFFELVCQTSDGVPTFILHLQKHEPIFQGNFASDPIKYLCRVLINLKGHIPEMQRLVISFIKALKQAAERSTYLAVYPDGIKTLVSCINDHYIENVQRSVEFNFLREKYSISNYEQIKFEFQEQYMSLSNDQRQQMLYKSIFEHIKNQATDSLCDKLFLIMHNAIEDIVKFLIDGIKAQVWFPVYQVVQILHKYFETNMPVRVDDIFLLFKLIDRGKSVLLVPATSSKHHILLKIGMLDMVFTAYKLVVGYPETELILQFASPYFEETNERSSGPVSNSVLFLANQYSLEVPKSEVTEREFEEAQRRVRKLMIHSGG